MNSSDRPKPNSDDDWSDSAWIDESPAGPVKEPGLRVRTTDPSNPIVLVETAFLASTASLIWLVNFYFPMGPLLQIFFPTPIALVYLRSGKRAAWMAALISGLLLTILMGPPRSIQYVVPYGLLGVLLGYLWQRKASWGWSIFLGTVLATIGSFFRIWLVSILLGDDLWTYSTIQVTGLLDWLFTKFGLLTQPTLSLVQAMAVGLIVFRNFVYLFVVHLVAWFLLDRLGDRIPNPPKWVQTLFEMES
jgi:uncharacterized protein YybS (DUF2232 family)